MKRVLVFLCAICCISFVNAQEKKSLNITKTTKAPKIDGVLDDEIWSTVEVASDFVQYDPEMGIKAAGNKKTEVRITYNDQAIYVAAYLYDNPEDIFKVFSPRDDFGQADYFGVTFNPNNDAQNDIKFYVMSSGTQADIVGGSSGRRGGGPGPRGDRGWNAVWDSAVKHVDDGWIVEMKIPYAALRFSNQEDPIWGIQFYRKYRKDGLDYSWSPIDRTVGSQGIYDGELKGLKNITPPTRLSFYPFASYTAVSQNKETVSSTGFGMDVKYGITESFTLDMTLIPDFSQAAFDKVELNLGPFEQKFAEQRQFFKEGVNLFNKGDLFYSRRIGNAPVGRYNIYGDLVDEINEVEEVIDNPSSVKMLNAVKVSGRNKNGLGIAVFNAITEKTSARIKNTKYTLDINDEKIDSTVTYRDATTEPFTNYNIIVLDQQFNQNSSISFVNTNVTRAGDFRDANASALLFSLTDKTNNYRVSGQGKMSRVSLVDDNTTGFEGGFSIGKVSGKYQYGLEGSIRDDKYDVNDMGFGVRNNFKNLETKFSYNVFEPIGVFNSLNIRTQSEFNWRHSNNDYTGNKTSININARTKNLMWVGTNITMLVGEQRDYFEPRDQENDRYYTYKNLLTTRSYIYTNSNKALSGNGNLSLGKLFDKGRDMHYYGIKIGPEYRFSDKLTIKYEIDYGKRFGGRGYVTKSNDEIIFGERNQKTIENTISGTLNFNSLNSLTLSFRNYWSTATYKEDLLTLAQNGDLNNTGHSLTSLDIDPNRNFNIWNLDLSYQWQFAPGSQLIALYRNQLFNSTSASEYSFSDSLKDLFDQDIQHTFSLKMIYFLDYNSLKGVFKKKGSVTSAP